jgi:hypothetical protein
MIFKDNFIINFSIAVEYVRNESTWKTIDINIFIN